MLSDFGTEVTLIETADRVLPTEDKDVSSEIAKALKKRGVIIHTGASLSAEGCQLTYHASWAARGKLSSWLGDFRIEGSRGILQLQDNQLILSELADSGECKVQELAPVELYPHDMRAGIVHEFISAWLEKRQSALHITAFSPVISLIYAAVESAETGMQIEIK